MNVVGTFLTVVGVLVSVAVLIVIASQATGPARRWGLIGAVLLTVGSIAGAALSLGATALFQAFDLPPAAYTLLSAPALLLRTVGLILVGVAVAARANEPTPRDQPQLRR